ncbi:MAG: DUF4386 family protein [Spirochaetales bacterium]|nr:DUF4386 family protein [Spirochaetales bacterium]
MVNFRRSTIGGVCALAAGLALLIIAVAYFFTPIEQSSTTTFYSRAFFASINKSFIIQEFLYWGLIFSGIFGIGVVVVVTDRLRDVNKDLAGWTSVLAFIGYGFQMSCNILGRDYVLRISPYYPSLDPAVQAVVNFQGNIFNDWAAFGLIGSWFIAINYMAFQADRFSRLISIAGMCAGIGYWLIPLGNIFNSDFLVNIAAASAIILVPLWYVRIGIILLQKPAMSK